jgi:hypothetical protein
MFFPKPPLPEGIAALKKPEMHIQIFVLVTGSTKYEPSS